MCELLIKVADSDIQANEASFKPDDVIYIGEDGHQWSAKEENESVFRIVKIPGKTVDEMGYLLAIDHSDPAFKSSIKNIHLRNHIIASEREMQAVRRYKYTDSVIDKRRA